jgi:hypothetical protein
MKALRRTLSFVGVFVATGAAHACTVCDSQNGQALRAGLFDGHFAQTMLLVAAPIPVLVAAVALLYLLMPDLPEGDEACAARLSLPGAEMLMEVEPAA